MSQQEEWDHLQEELDWLRDELLIRAEQKRSHLSAVGLNDLYESGDIGALRFHHLHWDGASSSSNGISMSVSAVTYQAALILGEEPIHFITADHFSMVQRFFRTADNRQTIKYSRKIELAPYAAILLGNPEREEFFTHLIVERGITTVDGLRGVMESSEGVPMAMNQGAL